MTQSQPVPVFKRQSVQLVLGLIVSGVCLWYALSRILREEGALQRMQSAFAHAHYWTLIPMTVALAGFFWLKVWRWQILLKPVGHFRLRDQLLPPTMIGFAFNNLLPAHLGDLLRVVLFAQRNHVAKVAVLTSVLLERVFDVIAVLLILGAGLLWVPNLDPAFARSAQIFGIAAAGAVAAGLVYVFWTRPFVAVFEMILKRVPFLPHELRLKLCGLLESGAEGLSSLKDVRLLAGILGTSLGQWLLNGLTIHLALWSFDIHVSPLVSCIVLGVTVFGVTVPSSPGYFGVIQLCFQAVLSLFGVDEATSFAASLYYQLSQYLVVTPIGLIYFNLQHRNSVQSPAPAAE